MRWGKLMITSKQPRTIMNETQREKPHSTESFLGYVNRKMSDSKKYNKQHNEQVS